MKKIEINLKILEVLEYHIKNNENMDFSEIMVKSRLVVKDDYGILPNEVKMWYNEETLKSEVLLYRLKKPTKD